MFKQQHRKLDVTPRNMPASHSPRVPRQEPPHAASRYDAGTGQGTISKLPHTKTLDHPILDGSTESKVSQSFTVNPFRGLRDPALREWNYSHAHDFEDDLSNEPRLRRQHDAEAAAHANDLEPRHWYKYDPFRKERNRMKLMGGTASNTAM